MLRLPWIEAEGSAIGAGGTGAGLPEGALAPGAWTGAPPPQLLQPPQQLVSQQLLLQHELR